MERSFVSEKFPIGAKLPKFSLPSTDGKQVSDDYLRGSDAALVVFTCNHCPYVKGSEEMLVATIKRFASQGLRAVAISSNDAVQYPADSFEKMREKSAAAQLPYPYLYDETQAVAKLFDAECTPELFLFNRSSSLVYHGTINDSPRDPGKTSKNFLETAIEQTLAGQDVNPAFVRPLGCSIKWKQAA